MKTKPRSTRIGKGIGEEFLDARFSKSSQDYISSVLNQREETLTTFDVD